MPGNRRHIPAELKELIVSLIVRGHDSKTTARIVECSQRTVNRVWSLAYRTGRVENKPFQAGRPRILTGVHCAFLEGCLERRPDLYLEELQQELLELCHVAVSINTISRTLKHKGWTRKHVSRMALERNEDRRTMYQLHMAENYNAEQLVFVDESAFNRHTPERQTAWAQLGSRARRHDHFIRGQRYSILPALWLGGILHLDIQERAYTAALFNEFIEALLDEMEPFPNPKSVLVMDNASIHKSDALVELVESRGMCIEFLPPYSPDYNPIEEMFSAMKAWLRRNTDRVRPELNGGMRCNPYQILWEAVFDVGTPENAEGWYRHSGYLA